MKRFLAIAIGAGLMAGAAFGQQYRWVDERGRVQYTDTPPPASAKDVKKKNLGAGAKGSEVVPYDLQKAQERAPVTLYTHPSCTESCQLARDVLNRRGVPFKEVPIVTNKDIEDLKTLAGSSSVPVLVVGSRIETAITELAYHAALDAGGYPKDGVLPARKQAAPPPPKPEDLQTASESPKPPAAKDAESLAPRGPYAPGAPAKPAAKPPGKSQ
jgi:glutaredoxin